MIFRETPLLGAYVIEPERIKDDRGLFARIWCKNELRQQGLETELAQTNVGFSYRKGTLRGLHFQEPPHTEVKIVRCTRVPYLTLLWTFVRNLQATNGGLAWN